VGEELLDSFDIDNLDLEVILYQSGYLTIDKMLVYEDDIIEYKLKLPNREVKISLNNYIIKTLTNNTNPNKNKREISKALKNGDLEQFKNTLIAIFASIPYNNFSKNSIANYEGFYATVVYIYLQSLGLDIIGEDVTNKGRIDLTIKMEKIIYIIEFKVGSQNALNQIINKNYHQKYLNENKKIYIIGINFDEKEKNISNFEWEIKTDNGERRAENGEQRRESRKKIKNQKKILPIAPFLTHLL
jgi:Holliday junction resolvase-like predicted endonuclease